jgi:iron(III) transport system ATP-binding protein
MRDVILDLVREAGITTVFVTHDQEEALALSDRIAIMDRGRIAQVGTPEELYGAPANAYVADFIGSANVLPVPAMADSTSAGVPARVRFQLAGRELAGVLGQGPLNGQGILIARPEELSLAAPVPALPNALPGQVLRRQYLGFKTSYRIQLHNGPEIRVEQHGRHTTSHFHPGDMVQVLLPPQSRVVAA